MRSVLDRSDREYVRLHQPHCANASTFGLCGYCYLLSTALVFPEEEGMMQQSSVSISLKF